MRRLVMVADASQTVEAIRLVMHRSGEFRVVGYAFLDSTSASVIEGARPDVVLVDDARRSERAIALIHELRVIDDGMAIIVLSDEMCPARLGAVFGAGAIGAVSKATRPEALITLLRETLSGHVFHSVQSLRAQGGDDGVHVSDAPPLTGRELEILRLVAAGSTNIEVARTLWITEQTVKFHLRNIYRKIDVANRTEASHFAHVQGLLTTEPRLAVAS